MQAEGGNPAYQLRRHGRWKLYVHPQIWSPQLWRKVLGHLDAIAPAHHPETRQVDDDGREFYLKIHHPSDGWTGLKDLFRDSKALRAIKQGIALSRAGFSVPLGVAAGEERRLGFPHRAFLLTVKIEGSPLPQFLRDRHSYPLNPGALEQKRKHLRQLAVEIQRLHQSGFVHGDLVPSNVFVRGLGDEISFFYLDHDRTRRYPWWLRYGLWKRNLVQLNRFVLPGISLQDRVRFLKCYLGTASWGKRERRLIHWLENKTRTRRWQCDGIRAEVSFRELMRWHGPSARNVR